MNASSRVGGGGKRLKVEEISATSCTLGMRSLGSGCCGVFWGFCFGFFPYNKFANLSDSDQVLLGDLTPVTAVDTDLSCQEQLL